MTHTPEVGGNMDNKSMRQGMHCRCPDGSGVIERMDQLHGTAIVRDDHSGIPHEWNCDQLEIQDEQFHSEKDSYY
jgi:hypothetical protein